MCSDVQSVYTWVHMCANAVMCSDVQSRCKWVHMGAHWCKGVQMGANGCKSVKLRCKWMYTSSRGYCGVMCSEDAGYTRDLDSHCKVMKHEGNTNTSNSELILQNDLQTRRSIFINSLQSVMKNGQFERHSPRRNLDFRFGWLWACHISVVNCSISPWELFDIFLNINFLVDQDNIKWDPANPSSLQIRIRSSAFMTSLESLSLEKFYLCSKNICFSCLFDGIPGNTKEGGSFQNQTGSAENWSSELSFVFS
jgi:hypothetical protein